MTERKPAGMAFTSWIDQQISEATERGAFDDLPGAGKPLPMRGEFDGQAWVRDYVLREGGSVEDCLPTPLKLRKEIERLTETVPCLGSEQEVREVVRELNQRIIAWRRLPQGPPLFVPLVDADAMASTWRKAQPAAGPPPVPAKTSARQPTKTRMARWRRRLGQARAGRQA